MQLAKITNQYKNTPLAPLKREITQPPSREVSGGRRVFNAIN